MFVVKERERNGDYMHVPPLIHCQERKTAETRMNVPPHYLVQRPCVQVTYRLQLVRD